MAKRDRKASGDVNDDLVVDDVDQSDTAELRPSGKRSARGRRGAGSATAVAERTSESTATDTRASRNPFVRIWIFLKQVVSEMRKVVWPTRNEMVNYVIAVFAFVVVVTAFIAGLDIGFAKLTLLVFG
ncbi:preprotein translocase subunit SecE [Gordonia neofelifaecis]|uniref:Protein translocase subunit SecE n=1 Tax=Gordonia neofelifaecis NRRL B-59395 TaxID=644548 RepID=F1YIK8_9ACTN|nr:preprotein translocase subunit SecE [Gordonia neofelifaecis]EGD55316.1 preprotein translocase subunit SecE [Gordonia neofelifaecis NRRL B-59395]